MLKPIDVIIFSIFVGIRSEDEPLPSVLISPPSLKIPTGETNSISCVYSGPGNVTSYTWYTPEEKIVTNNDTAPIYASADGILYVTNSASVAQSGDFNCTATYSAPSEASDPNSTWTTSTASATVPVTIYAMPTYLKEGLIVLGVNLALAGAFATYSVKTMVEDRRRLEQYEKR